MKATYKQPHVNALPQISVVLTGEISFPSSFSAFQLSHANAINVEFLMNGSKHKAPFYKFIPEDDDARELLDACRVQYCLVEQQ